MKRICKKLNSTRGASILFALLVFMLCAFAGAAALTAAAANAGRFTHAERDQQQYLSVASAMNLFSDEVGTPKLVFTQQFEETYEWKYEANPGTDTGYELQDSRTYKLLAAQEGDSLWKWYDGDIVLDDALLKTLIEEYYPIFELNTVPSDWYEKDKDAFKPELSDTYASKEFIIGPAEGSSENLLKNLDEVRAKVSLDPDTYAITIVLGTGEGENLAYETTMILPAVTSRDIESKVVTSGSDNRGQTVTTTTVTFTLEWPTDEAIIIRDWEG